MSSPSKNAVNEDRPPPTEDRSGARRPLHVAAWRGAFHATNRSWWRAVFGTSGRWAVFGLLGGLQADEWAGSPDCRQG
ncbi:hypothetical protein PF002_g22580 [Phytophthora fragariae]|uniref:Uncharacterized protein n=1 Tax=Phytophthora fragariae TaxID=53985 RepID=A0A6A3X7P8_9STRA|nr:hypothetical protein PF002_g22580 [Phytophthora fragariae]